MRGHVTMKSIWLALEQTFKGVGLCTGTGDGV